MSSLSLCTNEILHFPCSCNSTLLWTTPSNMTPLWTFASIVTNPPFCLIWIRYVKIRKMLKFEKMLVENTLKIMFTEIRKNVINFFAISTYFLYSSTTTLLSTLFKKNKIHNINVMMSTFNKCYWKIHWFWVRCFWQWKML